MMADMFIYVCTDEAKRKLIDAGYKLVAEDERNGIYTFLPFDERRDVLDEVSYLTGNTITL